MTTLTCAVCKKRKEKTPQEFELVCACSAADHGVCRPCYLLHGPGPEASPAQVQDYGEALFGGRKCYNIWRQMTVDQKEEFAPLSLWRHMVARKIFIETEAAERRARWRSRLLAGLLGFGSLACLYFIIKLTK
jgi:hypothetical protein